MVRLSTAASSTRSGLAPDERIAGFVHIGRRPAAGRAERPVLAEIVTRL